MAVVSGHNVLMFGLSAMANLSSRTKTPAKLVEYARAAVPARISAAQTVVGIPNRVRGDRTRVACDGLRVCPLCFFEATVKSLRPPEARLPLFARAPMRECPTRAARVRATTPESPSAGRRQRFDTRRASG